MKVNAITCGNCGDTIFSRARHDFRSCTCQDVSIDGGLDYTKLTYAGVDNHPEVKVIDVDATAKELYDDWNKKIDKYGRIPNEISNTGNN